MSRLTQDELRENPAKRTLQWNSEHEKMFYYNKDTKEKVYIDLPLDFVVLEKDYVSFNGFSDKKQKGFWSNEVKNSTDIVTVKCGNEIVATFKKENWNPKDKSKLAYRDKPELDGCNYTQILYVSAKLEEDTKPQIYRIMLMKSPLSGGILKDKEGKELPGQEKDGWIRFISSCAGGRNAVYQNKFSVSDSKVKKNKAISFVIPVYTATPLEDGSEYNEMAKEVEEWFKYYNSKPTEQPVLATVEAEEETKEEYADDVPF